MSSTKRKSNTFNVGDQIDIGLTPKKPQACSLSNTDWTSPLTQSVETTPPPEIEYLARQLLSGQFGKQISFIAASMDFLDDQEALQERYQTEGERWEAEESCNGYQLQRTQETVEDPEHPAVQRLFGEKQRLKDQGTALLRKWYEAQKREQQARDVLQRYTAGFLEDLRLFVKQYDQLQDLVAVDEVRQVLFGEAFGEDEEEGSDDESDIDSSDDDSDLVTAGVKHGIRSEDSQTSTESESLQDPSCNK